MSSMQIVNKAQYLKPKKLMAGNIQHHDINLTPNMSMNFIKQNLSNNSNIHQNLINKSIEKIDNTSSESLYKNLTFYATSILGMRQSNEDAHVSFNYKQYSVAALFDGHNGKEVSMHASKLLKNVFIKQLQEGGRMEYVLQDTVDRINEVILRNDQFNQQGCTSVIVVADSNQDLIHVSVVGDSRVIIGYEQNPRKPIEKILYKETKDHSVENDKERLINAGAHIVDIDGVLRVNGTLAVARSIGDHYLKQYVICKQDYYQFPLDYCQYILLCCDGLTEIFSSEEIDRMLRQIQNGQYVDNELEKQMDGKMDQNSHLVLENLQNHFPHQKHHYVTLFDNVNVKAPLAQQATQALTKLAYLSGSTDNVSVMLALLHDQ